MHLQVSWVYKSSGNEWWARYQPQDYRIIDNPLGNTADFKHMVKALKMAGVETYADIVFNHMANEAHKRNDLHYPGTEVLQGYSNEGVDGLVLFGNINQNLFQNADFRPAQCIYNYTSVWDVQHYRLCGADPDVGLQDLDENDWMISQQKTYLKTLKDISVTGFRVDAAKHMTGGTWLNNVSL
ncbi:hypothetical protein JQC92_10660 [Shewanella sp. 202IG2-18]|uniref:alpha-amylase family glycosyl hydrolase n=1 Tax=Parashewanella hymeniacidonis TaxID=2807618 RepID=UPI00196128A1|nr:alpha-amylase family glycosyl hydrolase [Parashewanella hymeniacidonis]MBM7072489.1 hypothetical protein [Parashewanella hymeniacidonis]